MTRRIDEPQPGYFRVRLVRGGPWVPCRIDHIDGLWSAEIDGKPTGLPHADPNKAHGVMRVWIYARPIAEDHYGYLVKLKKWARNNAPTHPAAAPRNPVNLIEQEPVF